MEAAGSASSAQGHDSFPTPPGKEGNSGQRNRETSVGWASCLPLGSRSERPLGEPLEFHHPLLPSGGHVLFQHPKEVKADPQGFSTQRLFTSLSVTLFTSLLSCLLRSHPICPMWPTLPKVSLPPEA